MTDAEFKTLQDRVSKLEQRKITQFMISPTEVKQRHIEALIVFRGDVADRPTDGSTQIQAFYAEDQKKLYIWNRENAAWEYVAFT